VWPQEQDGPSEANQLTHNTSMARRRAAGPDTASIT